MFNYISIIKDGPIFTFFLLHVLTKLLCVSCLYAAKVYFITSLKC